MSEAPTGSAPSGTPAAAAPAAATAAAPASAPAAWHSGYDAETVGWLENRGYTKLDANSALAEAIKGFRNAEKYVGVPAEQLVRLPTDDNPDSWNPVYDKLGRPKAASEYKVDVPEGTPDAFANWAKDTFYKHGASAKMVEGFTKDWNEYMAKAEAQAQVEYKSQVADEMNKLKNSWGDSYDSRIDRAKAAAQQLGVTKETLNKVEGMIGFTELMNLMDGIAGKMAEDTFAGGGNKGDSVNSPEGAAARIKALNEDKDFTARYLAGGAAEKAEMEKLIAIAFRNSSPS